MSLELAEAYYLVAQSLRRESENIATMAENLERMADAISERLMADHARTAAAAAEVGK